MQKPHRVLDVESMARQAPNRIGRGQELRTLICIVEEIGPTAAIRNPILEACCQAFDQSIRRCMRWLNKREGIEQFSELNHVDRIGVDLGVSLGLVTGSV